MKKDPYGVFEVVIPARNGQPAIEHNSKIKVWSSQVAIASADL
jgi:1,4-alpha-glucan branching enzyme